MATEVRNFAQRSLNAAREIQGSMADSVDMVHLGTPLASNAGQTMDEMDASVQRVAIIISEIFAASQQQSAGIMSINKAIGQMDEVTQKMRRWSKSRPLPKSLCRTARALLQTMSIFRLKLTQVAEPTPRLVYPSAFFR